MKVKNIFMKTGVTAACLNFFYLLSWPADHPEASLLWCQSWPTCPNLLQVLESGPQQNCVLVQGRQVQHKEDPDSGG